MTGMTNASGLEATLDLPLPRLVEGRFSNLTAFTDEALFETCRVRIAFTERSGGVSEPPYDSLNLGLHVNDNPESVRENRRRVCEAFGIDPTRLIVPNQVHGADVAVCENAGDIAETREFAAEGSDAVVVGCDGVAVLRRLHARYHRGAFRQVRRGALRMARGRVWRLGDGAFDALRAYGR